ncbi:MAG: hydroxysqualene dehydroxylase HpnE [Bacteroidota bacterium]
MDQRIAIVGGGYAGMAAAVSLAARGLPTRIYEAGPVLGGRARRVVQRGRSLDNGQHVLIGAYTELARLMRLVGVPDEALLRMPLELRYARGFALRALRLPAPFGLLGGLLAARGAPLAERVGALRFVLALRRGRYRLEADCSVEALLARHRQDGALGKYLWRALCVSALNTPPARASAAAFLAVLRDALDGPSGASDLLLPRVDLARLFPEPAAAFVAARGGDVRLNEAVRDLAALRRAHRAVIVAVGPHQLKYLSLDLEPELTYQPIYTCYLQYPERVRLPRPMLGLDEGLVQWAFDRGALLGERGLFACVISAEGVHEDMTHAELAAACHRELARALAGLPQPAWSSVIAEKRATVACEAGRARIAQATRWPQVFLAGDYTDPEYPPTLEAAVRSGLRAAQLAAP